MLEALFGLVCLLLPDDGTTASIRLGCPLALNRIYFPVLRKDLVDFNAVKLNQEISERHPP